MSYTNLKYENLVVPINAIKQISQSYLFVLIILLIMETIVLFADLA